MICWAFVYINGYICSIHTSHRRNKQPVLHLSVENAFINTCRCEASVVTSTGISAVIKPFFTLFNTVWPWVKKFKNSYSNLLYSYGQKWHQKASQYSFTNWVRNRSHTTYLRERHPLHYGNQRVRKRDQNQEVGCSEPLVSWEERWQSCWSTMTGSDWERAKHLRGLLQSTIACNSSHMLQSIVSMQSSSQGSPRTQELPNNYTPPLLASPRQCRPQRGWAVLMNILRGLDTC